MSESGRKSGKKHSVRPKINHADSSQDKKAVRRDYSALGSVQADICRILEEKPKLADNIAEELGIEIGAVLSELTVLELEGYVQSLPGKMFGIV